MRLVRRFAQSSAELLEPEHARLGRAERRLAWEELDPTTVELYGALPASLGTWAKGLEVQSAAPGVVECAQRARVLAADLSQVIADVHSSAASSDGSASAERSSVNGTAAGGARTLAVTQRGFVASLLPYDIATRFRGLVDQHPSAWIFTSATLALAGSFQHFATRLGLGDAATLCLDSPFDYERQALLYLPKDLPDPGAANYTELILEAARPLLTASAGGAFLLFTSHRALRIAAQVLRGADWASAWPLLVQNAAPREILLRQFRDSGRAILLGTASFWEGVDVQGAALRLVVIDKLPFAPPDDPQVRARTQFLRTQGVNVFRDYQLPEAALALKQGVGRLIRSETDRGVVMICDPRLVTRGYGRQLLASLPPMRVIREAAEASAMLCQCAQDWEARR